MDELFSDDIFTGNDDPVSTDDIGDFNDAPEDTSTDTIEADAFTDEIEATPEEAPAFSLPDSDDDLAEYDGLPIARQLAETRAYARQLAQQQTQATSDLGDPEYVKRAVETYRGFFSPYTNEHGEVQYHPHTGAPIYTAKPGLEAIAATSPGRIMQILHDVNSMQGPDGNSYLARFIAEGLQIPVEDFNDFVEGKFVRPEPPAPPPATVAAAEDVKWVQDSFGEKYGEAFEKYVYPLEGDEFFGLPEARQKIKLEAAHRQMENDRRLEQLEAITNQTAEQYKQAEQLEIQQFHETVKKASEDHVKTLRTTSLDGVVKNLGAKVAFSTDPAQNTAALGIVKTVLSAALDPDTGAAVAELGAQLGVQIDANFYKTLQIAATQASEITRLEAIAGNPRFAAYRDDVALSNARAALNSTVKDAERTLNAIAMSVSKALGATAKQKSDAVAAGAQQRQSRPRIGGSSYSPTYTSQHAPFSDEAFEEIGL